MSGEGETGLGTADVLAVVVADGEFGIRAFLVGVVDDADVAAAKDGPFVGVVGDGELGQVQVELFPHVQGEDEGFQGFVCRPLLLRRTPGDGSVAADHFAVLGLDQGQSAGLAVALLVELFNRKAVFRGAVDEL